MLRWLAPFAAAVLLLTYRLGDIAGLHRDEATLALLAEQILRGARPLRGYFKDYTAPLFYYLAAAAVGLLGPSIAALRAPGVLFNLAAAGAYADLLRRNRPGEAVYALWFLVTMPVFVVSARIAMESMALGPFFLFGGCWCFAVPGLGGRGRRSGLGFGAAGLLFALGAWNHLMFVPGLLGVAAAYLAFGRPARRELARQSVWLAAGACAGCLPKLYGVVRHGHPLIPLLMTGAPRSSALAAAANLLYTLGGDALYARACGEVLVALGWVLPAAALAAASASLAKNRGARWLRALVACLVVGAAGTWLITPAEVLGSRVWLLSLWVVPALLAASLRALPERVRPAAAAAVCAANLAGLGLNYFYAFSRTGGSARAQVDVGGRTDNSVDFMDMRPLVRLLDDGGSAPIFIQDFNLHRALFLFSGRARSRLRLFGMTNGPQEPIPAGSLIALFRLDDAGQPPAQASFGGAAAAYRPDLSTSNYVVYETAAAPRRGGD